MKKISYMLFICAALLITSCASTSRTGVISPFAYTEVHPNEIRADIDISENNKVTGKSKQWYVFGIRVSGGNKYGSSDISSDSALKRKTAEQIVYLNNNKQMYSYEQQFSISCLGFVYP